MSGSEIKQALRNLEFPQCAREALGRIETLCGKTGKQLDLQMELISEFVFGNIDRRRKRGAPVAILELQLNELFLNFFRSPGGTPAVRNAVFLSLFPAENPRYNILGNLVSLAIATENKDVLNAAGIWMQQLGSTSQQCIDLAKHVLNDYFNITPTCIVRLEQLPNFVPHFTANFLTAIGEVYKDDNPPIKLLTLTASWLSDNASLLLAALMDNPALPMGGIPMTPITPIAGLFRWTILSPLRISKDTSDQEEQQKCYSKIQQLLMDSVLHLKNSDSNKNAVSAQHLAAITKDLTISMETKSDINPTFHYLAMERLAQAVSSAMSANCIYGNKQELLALLQPLAYQHFLIEWTLETYAPKVT